MFPGAAAHAADDARDRSRLKDGQLRQPLEENPPPNALQQAVGEVGQQHFDGADLRNFGWFLAAEQAG